MGNNLLQLLKVPEIRQRIGLTLGLLAVYRLGFQVPIPGLDPEKLRGLLSGGQSWFGLINAFSGGDIGKTSVFSLGIMPYISASIIFSMLAKVSPKIEAVAKEGAAGQKKINQWTRLLAVPIALVQAFFIYTGVFLQSAAQFVLPEPGPGLMLCLVVLTSLTAGAMFCMWIGELITEYGVGNGASLIIMAGIVTDIPPQIASMVGQEELYNTVLYLVALWLVIVVVIVYITKGTRRIPIQYARLTRGRRVYGGQRHYLPLKINMAGVMPIIFASIVFVLPGLLFAALDWQTMKDIFSDSRGFIFITLQVVLIFAFCFFWNRLMFQPEKIADDLRERGSFVPGIRPGQKTAEFLDHTLTRITLAGAAFLALIAVLPNIVTSNTPLTGTMAYFLGGTSALIVVGVAMDVVDKLNAMLVMRNYEGFMKSSGSAWATKT